MKLEQNSMIIYDMQTTMYFPFCTVPRNGNQLHFIFVC